MNIKNHYLQISSYLAQTRDIWGDEILEKSPGQWPSVHQQMMGDISKLSHYQKWKLLGQRGSHRELDLSPELSLHFQQREQLSRIPVADSQRSLNLPSWAFQKVRFKKQHEISVLAQELETLRRKHALKKLIDIGGGQGHFARVMAHYFNWDTTSIDKEAQFIELGEKRLKKYPVPVGAASLGLQQLDFQGLETRDQKTLHTLFHRDVFSLGLHTCGPLAVRHLQTHRSFHTKGLLNFGCCYGKIEKKSDLNLSQLAQNHPIRWSTPGLNLAARAHVQLSYPQFCLQERVKSYRYALGLFLQQQDPQENHRSVGDSPQRSYLGSFSSYAKDKYKFLQKPWHQSLEEKLEKFYYSFETKEHLNELFCADILRWSFGRLLELGILLDRALYLSEQEGQKVELIQYFDESISPRNIGLLAYRERPSD